MSLAAGVKCITDTKFSTIKMSHFWIVLGRVGCAGKLGKFSLKWEVGTGNFGKYLLSVGICMCGNGDPPSRTHMHYGIVWHAA
jgi:hypothetical protein